MFYLALARICRNPDFSVRGATGRTPNFSVRRTTGRPPDFCVAPMVSSSCPFRTKHPVLSFASRSLARAIRIKYKINLPARETSPPRCWLDTEIDSRVTMQSITVPNQQIGGRLPGAHPVYTRMRVSSFTSREYLWRNRRFNGSQRSYYGESAYSRVQSRSHTIF